MPDDRAIRAAARIGVGTLLMLALTGCATTFAPKRLATPDDLNDVQSKTIGDVGVSVAILTDEQARQHFGVDLSQHGLQALWMSVRNGSDQRLWFIRNMLDPDFYSAEEAALLVRRDVRSDARQRLNQYFRDESIRVQLAPLTVSEGFVFLPRVEGGRYVDIRLQVDVYLVESKRHDAFADAENAAPGSHRELRFGFALPLPDGDFDYERLDPAHTYAGRAMPNLTLDELRVTLERLPCCATSAEGQREGDPLNVVIVGESQDLLNALSRSGWSFTHRIDFRTVRREVGAAIGGTAYPVAPVSNLYLFDRKQDVALQRARRSIAQRNHVRLWMAPFRYEDRPVWVGQVSRDIGVKVTPKSPTLTTHVIDPQVDLTREYLLHSLIGQGLVDRFGFVKGSAAGTPSQPRVNLTGDPYHSDGMRLVVILTPEPIPPDEIRSLLWEQSAPPIAEGQSVAAERNVRPIEPTAVDQTR